MAGDNSFPRTLTGSCLCGAVRYTVEDSFAYALNCHCSNCRRTTGAAFKPFAGISRDKLQITAGAQHLHRYGDTSLTSLQAAPATQTTQAISTTQADNTAHDLHCAICGSLLYSVVRAGAFVHVTLGSLLDTPTIRPGAHIFVGSKAPWYTITDQLPQHDEFN